MGSRWILTAAATLGAVVFAAAGALMGSMNAGWLGLERDANTLFPLIGVGVLLVVASWARRHWARKLWAAGLLGRAAAVLLAVAPVLFLLSWLIQFAIFGTLAFGIGLVLFAAVLWRRRLMATADRVMATVAAIASLTWNTETLSAFLLVAVGVLLAVLSLRLDAQGAGATIHSP